MKINMEVKKEKITEEYIRAVLSDFYDNISECGFEPYIITSDSPRLRRMLLSEEQDENGKNLRNNLKEMFFEIIKDNYLNAETEYVDGTRLADNQNKNLIIEQSGDFTPFLFLEDNAEITDFESNFIRDITGYAFCLRKNDEVIWIYQHLWSIMIPNKRKTNLLTKVMKHEDKTFFSIQKEDLLTITKKIDVIIMKNILITSNSTLLQKQFGFQNYINQSARQTVAKIEKTNLIVNTDKLTEYINRGNIRYSKKMMRIAESKVFDLQKKDLIKKIKSLDRWKDKFNINESNQIALKTYIDVENLIDLFDERYTRSEVTNTEYDTDVKIAVH